MRRIIKGLDRHLAVSQSRSAGGLLLIGILMALLPAKLISKPQNVHSSAGLISTEATEPDHFEARIEGWVRAADTHDPVADALIWAPVYGLSTVSGPDGYFSFPTISLSQTAETTQLTVASPDFGMWEIKDVWLFAGDTLILRPELTHKSQEIKVPPRRAGRRHWPEPLEAADQKASILGLLNNIEIPETIRVRVSGSPYHCNPSRPYTIEEVLFRDYVRHVLPNEWHLVDVGSGEGYWESMRAGAVAVKVYAWFWISQGGKWPDADVWDSTCDQVYNPAIEYASSNAVIDYTWNWMLTRDGQLIETNYRTYHTQCPNPESCLGQIEADQMAAEGEIWDEILTYFYQDTSLSQVILPPVAGSALRFFGNGYGLYDRVNIRVDDPANNNPGPPVDIGAEDFTIELWLRGRANDNQAPAIVCGENQDWIYGNVFLDRERREQDRHFGLALAGGQLVIGITGTDQGAGPGFLTLCSSTIVADGRWHHLVVQRRRADGYLWLFVDGELEAAQDGPDGDISYPDDALPLVNSDPYLVLGAGKRDAEPAIHPPFQGWLDELHISQGLRYAIPFIPPEVPHLPDEQTLALYRFDTGIGNLVVDSGGASGGPSHGERRYGGGVNGPDWFFSDLFLPYKAFISTMSR
jgi:hypothetical protein